MSTQYDYDVVVIGSGMGGLDLRYYFGSRGHARLCR